MLQQHNLRGMKSGSGAQSVVAHRATCYVPSFRSRSAIVVCANRNGKSDDYQRDYNAPVQSNKFGAFSSQQEDKDYELPRSESARKYFRTVYDFPNWQKHRSQFRLIDRLLTTGQSHVLQNVLPSIAWVGAVSALVTAYHYSQETGALPGDFPIISPSASTTSFIQNTSVALSLLLVFRTNVSYGRWDEARKMWGGLLNRSRDLMRQGCTLIEDEDTEAKKALARWIIAFTRSLRIHFQPETTLDAELSEILTPTELAMLKNSPHRPVKAIHVISQVIQNCNMSSIHQQQMSGNLTYFHDVLGGSERLLRAPIPVSYTRHTARFLFMWLTLLPLSLYGTCGIWTTPVVCGVAAVLCGIEEIGVQCEEPFGILPLDVICNRIQADVMQTLDEDYETKAILKESMLRNIPKVTARSSW